MVRSQHSLGDTGRDIRRPVSTTLSTPPEPITVTSAVGRAKIKRCALLTVIRGGVAGVRLRAKMVNTPAALSQRARR